MSVHEESMSAGTRILERTDWPIVFDRITTTLREQVASRNGHHIDPQDPSGNGLVSGSQIS
jgi:hypothetical protein